jgi:multiple sugar transport system substrate-binding protein
MDKRTSRSRLAAALVALAAVAAACSASAAATPPPTSPAAASQAPSGAASAAAPTAAAPSASSAASLAGTKLTVWTMEDQAKFEALIKPFEDKTGVAVKVVAVPWDGIADKLTTAVASGSGPDVTQVGLSLLPTFNAAGALLDLTPYLADHPALADSNFPSAVSSKNLSSGGAVTSVPWVADTRILFYRKDILDQAGIQVPTTWDEMTAAATKLATRGTGKYGYYIPQWDAPLPIEFTWQAGGDPIGPDGKVNLDTPQFRAAVDYYLSFYAKKLVPTASDFDQTAGFISGAAPMLISGPYLAAAIHGQAPELDGKWGVVTLPKDVTGTSLFAGSNMGVWKSTANPQGALALLDYLADPATQVAWYTATSELPANTKAMADPAVTSDPNAAVYAQQLQDAKLLPLTASWDKINSAILTALNDIALKGADKAATLSTLFTTVQGLDK